MTDTIVAVALHALCSTARPELRDSLNEIRRMQVRRWKVLQELQVRRCPAHACLHEHPAAPCGSHDTATHAALKSTDPCCSLRGPGPE